jgi:RimJ/RimL family protein N-acetyltransferase
VRIVDAATEPDLAAYRHATGYVPTQDFNGIVEYGRGKIHAFAGFDHWREGSVHMHVWLPGRASKTFVREVFKYVFETANKAVAFVEISAANHAASWLAGRLGFSIEARVPHAAAPGVDLIIMSMRRDECRWLGAPPA